MTYVKLTRPTSQPFIPARCLSIAILTYVLYVLCSLARFYLPSFPIQYPLPYRYITSHTGTWTRYHITITILLRMYAHDIFSKGKVKGERWKVKPSYREMGSREFTMPHLSNHFHLAARETSEERMYVCTAAQHPAAS